MRNLIAASLLFFVPFSSALAVGEEAPAPRAVVQSPASKTPQKLERKAVKIEDDGSEAAEENLSRVENPMPAYSVGRSSRLQLGVELFGSALLYSFQGSVLLGDRVALNGGLAYYSLSSGSGSSQVSASVFLVPFSASYLLGGPDHHFEVLAGGLALFASAEVKGDGLADRASGKTFVPEIGLGYRYWPSSGGFHFRATLYGVFVPDNFGVWPGLSFGYAF